MYTSEAARVSLVEVASGFESPWDIAFAGGATAYVTQKPGKISRVDLDSGARTPVSGSPKVAFVGQGGLLGIELHPEFASNGVLYLAYSVKLAPRKYTTRLARARLDGDALVDLQVIVEAEPALADRRHFGGALEFDRAGHLYLSIGDRKSRKYAQDKSSLLGKVLRLNADGTPAAGNPFENEAGALPEIFSLGHRNSQGLLIHPETGELWSSEHGPRGGDEINVVRVGRNYGWPIISYGREYRGGARIGIGTEREGLEQPVHYYVPSIGTSDIAFYTGSEIAGWTGDVFVGGLVGQRLSRVSLEGERATNEESLFTELGQRIRAVAQSPDEKLYLLTDAGQLLRIDAAE